MTAVVNVITDIGEECGDVCRINPVLRLLRVVIVDILWRTPRSDKVIVTSVIALEFREHMVKCDQLAECLKTVYDDFVWIIAVAFNTSAIGAEACDCGVHCVESLPFPS